MLGPILSRTAVFIRMRSTGTLREADFNIVTTTLGAMIEPKTIYRDGGAVVAENPFDSDITDVKILDDTEMAFFAASPLTSLQWPRSTSS
jgi:hypothetical protein